jgi:hypothetical protein
MEMAREAKTESLTFIKDVAASWFGSFECPCCCPNGDLRQFCQRHGYTDCYGAFMRFLFSEEV